MTYIIGLRTGLTDSTLKNNFFVMENVTVTIKKVMGRNIGTGTTITVTSDLDGSTIGEYTILIYGDINGDGAISKLDMTVLNASLQKVMVLNAAQKLAANLNGDRYITVVDVSLFRKVLKKTVTIDQLTGRAS